MLNCIEWNGYNFVLLDSLQDAHILKLSKRITSREELHDFGVNVLHLPEFWIREAIYDHRHSIQAATYELLSTWLTQQTSRQKAYSNLLTELRKNQMYELAGVLKCWVADSEEIGNEKGKIL